MKDQVLATLRGEVAAIMFGSIFLFGGLAACVIAGSRRRIGGGIFIWLGIWSAMYGAIQLCQSPAVVAASPQWLQISAPYANTAMTYLLVVVGSLSFMEVSLGRLRLLIQALALMGLAIAVAGTSLFVLTGSNSTLMAYNHLLVFCVLLALMIVLVVPKLSNRYLALPRRGILVIGALVFAIEALCHRLSGPLGFEIPRIFDHLGLAVLLFSSGYMALQMVCANERRLLSIEKELAIAREIQASILPNGVPELNHACVSAAYLPMTAIAGDFYEFLPVDRNRVGFLVADVMGHGVGAALIASMIKVAVQSVEPCAQDPQAVLRGLNHVLPGQLRGQFVSAAYLWLDTENRRALYSSAGHPPLLCWRQGKLERIESNGLLFGVIRERDDYPVWTMSINPGDRFLLCTDGVTEPENAHGDAFGDIRLEQVLRDNQRRTPSELSTELLSEIRRWQPASVTQQDDITLIVIDIV